MISHLKLHAQSFLMALRGTDLSPQEIDTVLKSEPKLMPTLRNLMETTQHLQQQQQQHPMANNQSVCSLKIL